MAISGALRMHVFTRDNYTCRYCGRRAPDVEITVDHVVPVILGGSDHPSNLVTACAPCNSGKGINPPSPEFVAEIIALESPEPVEAVGFDSRGYLLHPAGCTCSPMYICKNCPDPLDIPLAGDLTLAHHNTGDGECRGLRGTYAEALRAVDA